MKKQNFLFSVLMALCAMTVTTLFTSCGGDDAPQQQNPSDAPATAKLDCTLLTNDQALENFDFFVKWYDANGQIQEEKVVWSEQKDKNGRRFCETNVTAKLPATLGVYCYMKLKEGRDPKLSYYVANGFSSIYASYTLSGGIITYLAKSNFEDFVCGEGTLETYPEIEVFNVINQYDANGSCKSTTWK